MRLLKVETDSSVQCPPKRSEPFLDKQGIQKGARKGDNRLEVLRTPSRAPAAQPAWPRTKGDRQLSHTDRRRMAWLGQGFKWERGGTAHRAETKQSPRTASYRLTPVPRTQARAAEVSVQKRRAGRPALRSMAVSYFYRGPNGGTRIVVVCAVDKEEEGTKLLVHTDVLVVCTQILTTVTSVRDSKSHGNGGFFGKSA